MKGNKHARVATRCYIYHTHTYTHTLLSHLKYSDVSVYPYQTMLQSLRNKNFNDSIVAGKVLRCVRSSTTIALFLLQCCYGQVNKACYEKPRTNVYASQKLTQKQYTYDILMCASIILIHRKIHWHHDSYTSITQLRYAYFENSCVIISKTFPEHWTKSLTFPSTPHWAMK